MPGVELREATGHAMSSQGQLEAWALGKRRTVPAQRRLRNIFRSTLILQISPLSSIKNCSALYGSAQDSARELGVANGWPDLEKALYDWDSP